MCNEVPKLNKYFLTEREKRKRGELEDAHESSLQSLNRALMQPLGALPSRQTRALKCPCGDRRLSQNFPGSSWVLGIFSVGVSLGNWEVLVQVFQTSML